MSIELWFKLWIEGLSMPIFKLTNVQNKLETSEERIVLLHQFLHQSDM